MASKTFNELAMEFVKIYYACHPGKLPEDTEKAFQEMMKLHSHYVKKLIDTGTKKNIDFFSEKFREEF